MNFSIFPSSEKIYKVLSDVGNQSTLQAIRNSFVVAMPLLLIGAFGLLLVNFPLPVYQSFMQEYVGDEWRAPGIWLFNATFSILSLLLSYSISYNLAEKHNEHFPLAQVNPILVSLVSFVDVLLLMQPLNPSSTEIAQWGGVSGLFVSIFASTISSIIILNFAKVRALRLRLYAEDADQVTPQTFELLIPAILTVLLFTLFKLGVYAALPYLDIMLEKNGVPANIHNVHEFVYQLMRLGFSKFTHGLGGAIIYVLGSQIAWFFGVHGPNLLDPITHDIYAVAASENMAAAAAGQPLPHIITKDFFDHFIYSGGSGATLGLIISILALSRDGGSRRVAFLALFPGVFNINEIIIFGLPIIINPIFLIPFLLTPIVLVLVNYFAIDFGLVPQISHSASWTTPTLISGYVVTGSASATVLQVFNLLLSALIYAPFVTLSDRVKRQRFKTLFGDLLRVSIGNTLGPRGKKCIDRSGGVGVLARGLANDLEQALARDNELFLMFQPQIDYSYGKVCGVEALLRWNHPVYGLIPPPIAVAVAEDSMLIQPLGLKVLDYACATRSMWRDEGILDLKMSVNLSVNQLEDSDLPGKIISTLGKYKLPPNMMELEITESAALDPDATYIANLHKLNSFGLEFAIDDFGMGHSSLTYIKHFPVGTLKIDASLSKDVLHDAMSQEVIIAITEFCAAMGINSVVEFIESEDQLALLHRLGCKVFQGYLFSPPISADACLSFILNYHQENKGTRGRGK